VITSSEKGEIGTRKKAPASKGVLIEVREGGKAEYLDPKGDDE